MNIKEAATLLGYVTAAMPNIQDKNMQATAKLWAAVMPDIPFELGQRAIFKILREKKIPTVPLPGKIIETAKEITKETGAPPDYEAWQEVRSKIDPYKHNIKWSHPAIAETVKIIGSQNICGGDFDTARRFMWVYNALIKREAEQYENKITLQISENVLGGNLLSFITQKKQLR